MNRGHLSNKRKGVCVILAIKMGVPFGNKVILLLINLTVKTNFNCVNPLTSNQSFAQREGHQLPSTISMKNNHLVYHDLTPSGPQQKDVMKALPKPLPASMVGSYLSNKKEDEKDEDEQEENEQSVEHLSPQDLLKRHIKRAKRVRARLREERLQRITRYRSRLRLLLPPAIEQ
ncbi:hypothetical protein CR513_30726, partial [Mucuna pruriens]